MNAAATTELHGPLHPPEIGQMVRVRSRTWTVTAVEESVLPTERLAAPLGPGQSLVTLSSLEDDGLGEELTVVWELEPGARVIEKVALPEPSGIDPPARLDAFLDAVRWGAAVAADRRRIQAPFRAGIEIEDYQLDPLVRAIQMPRVNLLVADDVGLGKTIESGLVALELILRHRARRILVVCPSALQIQWREQMRDKFGLDFRIVDSELMKELRRRRGVHVNPWTHFPRLITSIDFLKRERPLRLLREVLPGPNEPQYPRKFDLLICDEAHHVAPPGRGRYAMESQRTQALRALTPHCEHRLFLTATPHNGYPESFTALLELLDNQRFARGTQPDKRQLGAVMVRRLKRELPPRWDGKPRFPERVLVPLEVQYTKEERAIHRALAEYGKRRQGRAETHAAAIAAEFVHKTLKKRLFSSPAAFLSTLSAHEAGLTGKRRAQDTPSLAVLEREIGALDEEYADDASYETATTDALDVATQTQLPLDETERLLLQRMRLWAEKATTQRDEKAKALLEFLREHLRDKQSGFNRERVIIFTEYRATQNWLHELLALEGFGGERLMTMYGGMDSREREQVKAAFQADPAISPVRILLATDAASEGLDLQNHCARLVHYEIPWNPNRMEQRNGRIDRHGQRAPRVLIHHFVGSGYATRKDAPLPTADDFEGDLIADLEFLAKVAHKVEQIREDLGSYSAVLAEDVERAMLGDGYRFVRMQRAEARVEPARRMLRFERDLKKQIEDLVEQLNETQRELRLSPAHVCAVVEVALELADQPPLMPSPAVKGAFLLPPLRGSWAACAEGLLHPHTQAVRPITFDHAVATGRDDVVLVHLNHRLVQMSLRLLRAEVWAPGTSAAAPSGRRLHRVSARLIPDHLLKEPAAVAHARLVLVGGQRGGAHRLHEELIMAGGPLKEGKPQRATQAEIDSLLAGAAETAPPAAMQERLLAMWPQLVSPLQKALEARAKDRTATLQKRLAERRDKEAQDLTAILQELQRSIERELHAPEDPQLKLFSDKEKQEFDQNKNFLEQRLAQIPTEIEREVAAIHARYADPQARMFPVAVTFLVPERMAK